MSQANSANWRRNKVDAEADVLPSCYVFFVIFIPQIRPRKPLWERSDALNTFIFLHLNLSQSIQSLVSSFLYWRRTGNNGPSGVDLFCRRVGWRRPRGTAGRGKILLHFTNKHFIFLPAASAAAGLHLTFKVTLTDTDWHWLTHQMQKMPYASR